MKTLKIPQKMSNTGSIHDIASEHWDREIKFRGTAKYAVVLASYYGGKGHTTHATEAATIAAYNATRGYSREIVDADGHKYWANGGQLVMQ